MKIYLGGILIMLAVFVFLCFIEAAIRQREISEWAIFVLCFVPLPCFALGLKLSVDYIIDKIQKGKG